MMRDKMEDAIIDETGKWIALKEISQGIPDARRKLAEMAKVGIIKVKKVGRKNYYQISAETMKKLTEEEPVGQGE